VTEHPTHASGYTAGVGNSNVKTAAELFSGTNSELINVAVLLWTNSTAYTTKATKLGNLVVKHDMARVQKQKHSYACSILVMTTKCCVISVKHLQYKLIFHDSLNWLDQQVRQLKTMPKPLPQLLYINIYTD